VEVVVTQVQVAVTWPDILGDTETKFLLMVLQDAHTASRCHNTCYKTLGKIQKVLVGRGNLVVQYKKKGCSFISSAILDEF